MKIIKGDISQINEINGLEKSVVVIGNFDGVHKYHQKLFKMAQEIADQDNLSLVIITFDQSFEDYFHQTNQKIFSNEEKIDLIKNNFEIDYYIELKVNKNITQYNKMMFMTWLKEVIKVEKIVEGSDFTFGKNKEGKVSDLKTFFGKKNVIILRRLNTVSSTKIRRYLADGKIKKAQKNLLKPLKKN